MDDDIIISSEIFDGRYDSSWPENAHFRIPTYDPEKYAYGVYDPESGIVNFRNIFWFTNLEHHLRNEIMILFRRYHQDTSKYPHYDNYDAIEVRKIADFI